ncbi:uncharacterized protein, partial [Parasteatoda tepidariorum]|uniref:uncharacterized protein n=1 Tax=Parasteatoda tepidariorum TaxID=114398 RepID=UPI001C722F20
MTLLGIKHIHTTAYHPFSNGLIENWHRTLKASLKAHLTDRWTEVLPTVLLGMRSAFRESIKATTAELVYGTALKLPGEFLMPTPKDFYASEFCKQVFIRHDAVQPPLKPAYDGPFEVLERTDKVYKVQVGNKSKFVTIDRLKPVYILNIPESEPEPVTNHPSPPPEITEPTTTNVEHAEDKAKHTRF